LPAGVLPRAPLGGDPRRGARDRRPGPARRPLRVGSQARLRRQGLGLDYPRARWHPRSPRQPAVPVRLRVLLLRSGHTGLVGRRHRMALPAPVVTLLAFGVALGLLVFVHELGHFAVAKRIGVKVLRFSIGFGPILFSRQRAETEYAVSAMPLGGYVKMLGEDDEEEMVTEPERAFSTQTPLRRSAIVFAGPVMNFLFAFVVYALLFAIVGAEVASNEPRVGGVAAGSPAEEAGLKMGDKVVAVDGQPTTTWEALAQTVRDSKGKPLALSVDRDGKQIAVTVTPKLRDSRTMFGEDKGQVYLIGIEASHDWQRVGPVSALGMAAQQT